MSPSFNHGFVQIALGSALFNLKEYSVCSEISLEINGKEYVPDICLYPKQQKFNPSHDIIKMTELPLLAIEVLSPSQVIQELVDKIGIYLNAGIQSCWLVIPTTCTITVYSDLDSLHSYSNGEVVDKTLNISLPLNDIFPF